MDDDLEQLERAHAQDPGNAETAARLKAALLRAGRRDEVRQRYELAFVCKQRWSDMRGTSDPTVRVCFECARPVHLARTYEDVDRLGAAGQCAAVDAAALPRVLDGLIDTPAHSFVRAKADPCVLPDRAPGEPSVAPQPTRQVLPAGGLRVVPRERLPRTPPPPPKLPPKPKP